jgi:hypothetical protein
VLQLPPPPLLLLLLLLQMCLAALGAQTLSQGRPQAAVLLRGQPQAGPCRLPHKQEGPPLAATCCLPQRQEGPPLAATRCLPLLQQGPALLEPGCLLQLQTCGAGRGEMRGGALLAPAHTTPQVGGGVARRWASGAAQPAVGSAAVQPAVGSCSAASPARRCVPAAETAVVVSSYWSLLPWDAASSCQQGAAATPPPVMPTIVFWTLAVSII